ncbi:MAG: peptide deformylase [Gammaproteobacteria bacterium]|nr:peptide deformylase [Gammaproteobacteria bacterium]
MAILEILHFPDTRLRTEAQAVKQVDSQVHKTIEDMFETMYKAPGVGLAATQVNIHRKIITIDITEERNQPLCLVNPEILSSEGTAKMEEGCLSVPDIFEFIARAEHIRVRALDRDGQQFELEADKVLAAVIQHEIDHLCGKLFIDYLSPLRLQRIRTKLRKQRRRT